MDLRSSVLDELLVTEGLLFKDECAKLLYMDVKTQVNKTLLNEWEDKKSMEDYENFLNELLEWEDEIEESQERKVTSYCLNNLPKVTVLYAKYLFSKEDSKDVIKIRKPHISTLLYGIYKRMCRTSHVRSGSYFELDPLRQDFVFRECFRMALSDCIDIIEDKIDETKNETKYETKDEKVVQDENKQDELEQEKLEELKLEEEMKIIEEVTEQDSISNFCGRTVISARPPIPENNTVISKKTRTVIEEKDNQTVVSKKATTVLDNKSTHTKVSKVPTSVSTFSKPQFRKIILEEVPT